ncbi:RNA polymerase sigma factor [Opitutus sp. ER46]|uniref:RNA polymerase sigma factor n=1 Tax=Opitutus sp. ER46 TaxID=2161864 RepID=UPI000D31FD1C|nr:RNA polymerase sigma factor [Opitutus sp. ER46]PTX91603.1 RNA polymerase subunit sigma-24 [Opitutus sp. ER46]
MDAARQLPTYMSTDKKTTVTAAVAGVGRQLMRFVRARVATQADADDILQDVWQQLITTLDSGPIEQVGAWLYTVARNRIIDRRRKPSPTSLDALAEDEDDGLDMAEWLLRDDKTPRTEHLRRRFWEELHAALAELPDEQRQVFVWHELEALSFEDIAALTGENVNTLLSRKRYAVLHLRTRLESLRREFLTPPR